MEASHDSLRIGYVLKVFPRVSETFVINEIRAMESAAEDISVFSLHHNPAGPVRHGILQDLRAPLTYVDDTLPDEAEVGPVRKRLAKQLKIPHNQWDRLLPRKYVRLAMRLAQLAEQAGIQHLHAHFASRATHVSALAAHLCGIPFSLTAHAKDIYHEDTDSEALRWKIEQAAFTVTVTDYNLRHLRELLADKPGVADRVVRIYNGVEMARFGNRRDEPAESARIVSVGRLVEKKGFDVLIRACAQMKAAGRTFRCEIIGGGGLEQELRNLIGELRVEDVCSLVGSMSTEEVAEYLRAASMIVLPCVVARDGNVDALPTVLLEAMACARPVVSTRLSGIPEIVEEGRTGLLVDPSDIEALADALGRLLDHPEEAAAMGQFGRDRAESLFDLHVNAKKLRRLVYASAGLVAAHS